MTEISAAMVKQLRDATSAGMMDCKRALQETDGDFDAAVKLLREKGMASAAKRAEPRDDRGRRPHAGRRRTTATIVAVGCETEPVSKNEDFRAFAHDVLDGDVTRAARRRRRARRASASTSRRGSARTSRSSARGGCPPATARSSSTYVHPPANKIGVLARRRGGSPELARQLAMHISFARPTYRSRDEVPAELVEAEREILMKLPEVESKPADVREKIVDGMLNKRFYAESVLGEQTWIHDNAPHRRRRRSQQGGLELVDYAWFSVG